MPANLDMVANALVEPSPAASDATDEADTEDDDEDGMGPVGTGEEEKLEKSQGDLSEKPSSRVAAWHKTPFGPGTWGQIPAPQPAKRKRRLWPSDFLGFLPPKKRERKNCCC